MRKHTEIEAALFFWLEPLAIMIGVPTIIFTDQDAPQPVGDFISIDIEHTSGDGRPEKRFDSTAVNAAKEINEKMIYRGITRLTIRVFSKIDSFQKAEEMKTRMWSSRSEDRMTAKNIGIHTIGSVRDSTFLEEANTRQRADIPLTIHTTRIYDELIESIGHVPLDGKATNADKIILEVIDEP